MITIEKTVLPSPEQWEIIIECLRNPMNSWDKMDSFECVADCCDCNIYYDCPDKGTFHYVIGTNDHELMMKLSQAGSDHAKFRRMIPVYVDIVAPLYWWKEFDTYKVGTVANSCSTMHKIHAKEFTLDDFSYEHLIHNEPVPCRTFSSRQALCVQIEILNMYREMYLETKDKKYWWQMIQLLPSSYNQRRTVMLNYEVLANIYRARKGHKLDEWEQFREWIRSLPYSEIITLEEK